MMLLATLPLLPVIAALWLSLSNRRRVPGVFELVSLAPIAVALFIADASVGVPYFLTTDVTVFELDADSRAPLLLFGSLWLIAGLLDRRREYGRAAVPLLLALAGAILVALAQQGPAVLCGMLVAGFGLSAVVSLESGSASRRPVRVLAALLVASYVLVFEALLHAGAHPLAGISPASAAMIVLAVILSGALPPAHVWLAPALVRASAPTSVLLAGATPGVALTGGFKLLAGADAGLAPVCLVVALAGTGWSAWAASGLRSATATLACATAATASLLLLTLTAPGAMAPAPWMTLSLLAACAALALLRAQRPGLARSTGMIAVVLLYAIAAGELALHTASALPRIGVIPASAGAVLATLLVTLTAYRIAALPVLSIAPRATWFTLLLAALAAAGIAVAWLSGANDPAMVWPATIGIGLGLLLPRVLRPPGRRATAAGKPRRRAGGALLATSRAVKQFTEQRLPRFRDQLRDDLVSQWDGETWVARIARLEALLGRWPTTALGMLFVAIAIGLLLLG